jgi:hypothetical protein
LSVLELGTCPPNIIVAGHVKHFQKYIFLERDKLKITYKG